LLNSQRLVRPTNSLRTGATLFVVAALLVVLWSLHSATIAAQDRTGKSKIGELWLTAPTTANPWRAAFHQGLRDLGYIEGHNLTVLTRYAGGDSQRFAGLIDELLDAGVNVLFLIGQAVPVAKARTTTVPIVSAGFSDPVAEGIVFSLSRPGGNVTGLSWGSPEMSGKRLELALELVPRVSRIAVLYDTGSNGGLLEAQATRTAVQRAGLQAELFPVSDPRSLKAVLPVILQYDPQILIAIDTNLIVSHRTLLAAFAKEAKIPLVAEQAEFAEAGALFSYGASGQYIFRRAATYIDKILKGTNAGDIPIEQPREFELVLNAATAEALGLKLPQAVVLRAKRIVR